MKKIYFITLILLVSFVSISHAQAPVFAPPGVEDQLTVRLEPENPGANTPVKIFIESFSTNLNKAYIVWRVNGELREEGRGKTTFNFQTGNLGSQSRVGISIQGEDGRLLSKTITFEPASVTLIAEALTYTPPFYKGKALFTPQADVKIVAFPEFILPSGAKISAENLTYTWQKDGKVLQADSGFGKSILLVEGSIIPRPMDIVVDVGAVGSNLKAVGYITLKPEEPELLFYENNLIYGPLWNRAIKDNFFLTNQEINLRAEPYYLSAWNNSDPSLTYRWKLNGTPVNINNNESSLGLRNETNEEGSARLDLTIDRDNKILQTLQDSLYINFNSN